MLDLALFYQLADAQFGATRSLNKNHKIYIVEKDRCWYDIFVIAKRFGQESRRTNLLENIPNCFSFRIYMFVELKLDLYIFNVRLLS
jgi:hypothetical protein